MAVASQKSKTTTAGKKTREKTKLSFDTQKAREAMLNQKNGVCPFCGQKL